MKFLVKNNDSAVLYQTPIQSNILRNWLTPHSNRAQLHQYQYSPSQQEIYEHSNQCTSRWFATELKANMFTINKVSKQNITKLPFDSFPIIKVKINSIFKKGINYLISPNVNQLLSVNILKSNHYGYVNLFKTTNITPKRKPFSIT